MTFFHLSVSHDHLCSPCPDSECVVVSDSDPDPNFWIQKLDLFEFDLKTLQKGMDITGNIVNAAQMVLKLQFEVQGLQSTTRSQSLLCNSVPHGVFSIQILYTGMEYILFLEVSSTEPTFLQELTTGFVVHVIREVQCNYMTAKLLSQIQ